MGPAVAPRSLAALACGAALSLLVTLPAVAETPPSPVPPAAVPPAAAAPPSCAGVVAAMTPRAKLAQRLVVGVGADDVVGTVETVRDAQVGGIFVGGNATPLLKNQALRKVQAVARIPVSVAVDDEGGRVQRVDDARRAAAQRPRDGAAPGGSRSGRSRRSAAGSSPPAA